MGSVKLEPEPEPEFTVAAGIASSSQTEESSDSKSEDSASDSLNSLLVSSYSPTSSANEGCCWWRWYCWLAADDDIAIKKVYAGVILVCSFEMNCSERTAHAQFPNHIFKSKFNL